MQRPPPSTVRSVSITRIRGAAAALLGDVAPGTHGRALTFLPAAAVAAYVLDLLAYVTVDDKGHVVVVRRLLQRLHPD